jgi:hypothetical protein
MNEENYSDPNSNSDWPRPQEASPIAAVWGEDILLGRVLDSVQSTFSMSTRTARSTGIGCQPSGRY